MYIRDITPQICEWLEELKMLRALKNEHRKLSRYSKKLANKQNEKNMKKQKKDMKVSKEEI